MEKYTIFLLMWSTYHILYFFMIPKTRIKFLVIFLFLAHCAAFGKLVSAGSASIVLELKNLEYINHSYALVLLCQFFPSHFTLHVYKICCYFLWFVVLWICTITRGFGGNQSCAIRGLKLWGIHEFWFASNPVFKISKNIWDTWIWLVFFPFQSLMSIDTTEE